MAANKKAIAIWIIGTIISIALGVGIACMLGWNKTVIDTYTLKTVEEFNEAAYTALFVVATLGIGASTAIAIRNDGKIKNDYA